MKRILPLLFLCSLLAACGGTGITGMRTEYMDSPLGVDVASPRFTWVFEKTAPEACAVAVATSPGGLDDPDMWLSPFTPDSPVVYGGEPLESHTRYYWKVVSRTGGKEHSSPAAWFETGKMSPSDWQAQWISDGQDKDHRPMPLLRREVEVSGTAASARLYVSGLGYYEMFINGEKVGDKMLDPGYTHFDKRAYYSTYDVTDMLKSGGNALCAALGNGWFNVQALSVWRFELARWRQRPRMICELHIEYADGTREVIASGDDWKTSTGALQFADLYSGEYYDARKEPAGWKNAGFDDAGWSAAQVVPSPAPLLQSELFPPIRITEQYAATGFKQFSPQLYVYSFPVNMSGVTRINIKGEAGTKVYIRHGELLHPDGHLDQSNIDPYFHREDNPLPLQPVEDEYFQTNIYVLRGDAAGEEYMPSFTYHGFQYVEVESDRPVTLTQESLTAQFMHTDLIPAGSFSCSNELLNKFYAATMQSYLSNWHSIPTDCPQREKNGWTADAWISMDLGLLSFDGVAIYEKWLRDFEDNTTPEGRVSGIIPSAGWGYADWIGPVWDAAMFIIPTALYDYYGDKRAIEHIWPTCEKYMAWLATREENGLPRFGIGDWVYYKTVTPSDYTTSAYYYYDLKQMVYFAELLGKDAKPWADKAAAALAQLNEEYYDAATGTYSTGTMAAQAVALWLELVPAGGEQKVADVLAAKLRENDHKVDFGMLGSKTVLRMLTRYGYVQDAFRLASQTGSPGWLNWVGEKGHTTLPETWTLDEGNKDASLNHVFLGDIVAWLVNDIAGIAHDGRGTGFRHFVVAPHFVKGLDWAKAEYNSVRGMIRSQWVRQGGKVTLTVEVPVGSTATLRLDGKESTLPAGVHNITVDEK